MYRINFGATMAIIKRLVEKSVEATMNLEGMQFLKAKTRIEQTFEGEESEVHAAEAALWQEVAKDIRRGMWTMIKTLGSTTDADKKFFDACSVRVQAATLATKQSSQTAAESPQQQNQAVTGNPQQSSEENKV